MTLIGYRLWSHGEGTRQIAAKIYAKGRQGRCLKEGRGQELFEKSNGLSRLQENQVPSSSLQQRRKP